MSALGQAIAALWAAVWVRWRLLAVRGRRLLGGGGPAAAAGSGYYLSPAEIPVEGVDFELLDLPPELEARLDTARAELVDHARVAAGRGARRRRVRRRRTASVATAAVVSLAVVGAGANALVSGSTGVPAVDRLLGIYEAGQRDPSTRQVSPQGDLAPRPGGKSTSVRASVNGLQIVSTSFVGRNGRICTVTTQEQEVAPSGDFTCIEPDRLAQHVAERGGLPVGVGTRSDNVVLWGFVDDRVVGMSGHGPAGPLDFEIGESWTPEVRGADPLKAFLAVGARPRREDGKPTPTDPGAYSIEAVLADGSRMSLAP